MRKKYSVIFFSFFIAVSLNVSASSKYSNLIDSLYSAEDDKIDALVESQRGDSITEEELKKRTKIEQQASELIKIGFTGNWLVCKPIVEGEGGLKEIELCLVDTAKADQLVRDSQLNINARERVIKQKTYSAPIIESYARDQQDADLKNLRLDGLALLTVRNIFQDWYNILKKRKDDLLKENSKETGVDIFD